MKSNYPEMKHSHDIWHTAKNLTKKIIKAGQDRECRMLQKWAKHIANHFWYCCQKATSEIEFRGMWGGVLHHVINEHEWIVSIGSTGSNHCHHGPLAENADEEKEWLKKNSKAHSVLRNIIFDRRFLKKIPFYLNARETGELENFQQQILQYASKRFAYTPPVYRARNRLAAIDHNIHYSRNINKNRHGEIMYKRIYNKKSGRWIASPLKVEKTYPHIRELKKGVIQMRLADEVGMYRPMVLEDSDPRRISANLAPVIPPPVSTLVQEQIARRS
ncbi:uncharacterized protein [Ptychodera flava]|uniref:uncharacterized protein isoform X1 n=2 Tax=Ptychodera flava TaxID=63121 RepID=UPI00396AAFA5